MGLIAPFISFFSGLSPFFEFIRGCFQALPLVIKLIAYLAFGGFMLLVLLHMLATRG